MTDLVTVRRDALRELFFETYNQGWLTEPSKSFRGLETEIEARLAAMTVSPWQPIETAPRDGTEILVSGVVKKQAFTRHVLWDADPAYRSHPWQSAEHEWKHYDTSSFTHWQPLPEPPK